MKTKILIPGLLIIILSIFLGCEKEYDNVIENEYPDYQVTFVGPSDSIQYNPTDSLVKIRINLSPSSKISNAFCDVYSSDNTKLNSSSLVLYDNGKSENGDDVANDNNYANKIPLSESYPNGIYNIKYFVTDNFNSTKQVALGTFKYNNGKTNIAPVISDDIINPDTAVVTGTTVILTSIKASDQNGLSDISKVYFIVYRPDGSTNNTQTVLFDDGDLTNHGDLVLGDGIYSLLVQITTANAKGNYRFEFRAIDRGGKLSNIINHNVLIQ